jgi:hypothetical protein
VEPFPFVVGCERSGTTLLRLMLDANRDLAIPPESYFIVDLHRRLSRYGIEGDVDLGVMAADLRGHRWFSAWELDLAGLQGRGQSFPDAVRRIYETYAAEQGKHRYGDKTPAYVMHLPLLARLFPEGRFVHLIRDGRDVALSLADVSWGPGTVLDAAIQWRERVERGRKAGKALGSERYREVRYERLVEEPEPVLRELAEFLGLEFDPAMLSHHERAGDRIAGGPKGIHRRAAEAPTASIRDWRAQMARANLEAVEAAAGALLTELGYERAVSEPSSGARRRVRWAEGRRRRRHTWRRLKFRLGRS